MGIPTVVLQFRITCEGTIVLLRVNIFVLAIILSVVVVTLRRRVNLSRSSRNTSIRVEWEGFGDVPFIIVVGIKYLLLQVRIPSSDFVEVGVSTTYVLTLHVCSNGLRVRTPKISY